MKESNKFSEWLTITWMPPRLFRLKYGENLSEITVVQDSTNWCTRPATKVSLVLLGTRNASARPVPLSNMPQTHVPRLLRPRLYLHLWPNIDSLINNMSQCTVCGGNHSIFHCKNKRSICHSDNRECSFSEQPPPTEKEKKNRRQISADNLGSVFIREQWKH